MGNLAMSGIPSDKMAELNLDFNQHPPWPAMWTALYIDMFCSPLQCGDSWRKYVPFGLADPGGWFSNDYAASGIVNTLAVPLTFEQFQSEKGLNVTDGSGMLAGFQGLDQWSASLYEYAFLTPSTALSNLWTPTSLMTVALIVLFFKAVKAVAMPRFQAIGRQLGKSAHGEDWLEDNEERITKFGEYVFRLFYHSFISIAALYFYWFAPWWDEDKGGTINLFTGFPHDPISPAMSWYYLFQAAYNVDALISLLQISFEVTLFPSDSVLPIGIKWSDTVRGDFNEMLAHHIVTNALVYLSSYFCQTRIGSMVFWMHDISDVPVDLCKLANFVKWKNATIGCFVFMCYAWAHTRLVILPFKILKSIYIESYETIRGGVGMDVYYYTYQPIFLILLSILILLHAVWFSMFLKMFYVLATKGETHDMTEHKKGEGEGHTPTNSPKQSPRTSPSRNRVNGNGAAAAVNGANGVAVNGANGVAVNGNSKKTN